LPLGAGRTNLSALEVPLFRALLVVAVLASSAGAEPRARDLGIPFEFGTPGKSNAITDVAGVEIGHVTLVEGDSIRTGITAILPRGKADAARVPCLGGYVSLNGNGEMTGTHWVEESGIVEGPIVITNTNSVGVVRDAVISYAARRWPPKGGDWTVWSLPIVAETWDGDLNDIYGMHVKSEHLVAALDRAAPGPVAEGGVGGGTGMICHEFKGGIGTASRVLPEKAGRYTVGVLVQANHGLRHQLRIAGLPVGAEIAEGRVREQDSGSIIIVVATDAPLLPHQLKRLARRAALGLARTGSVAGNGSGDIFIAFSTANGAAAAESKNVASVQMVPNDAMGPLFEATVGATEEAIVNALVAGRTMTGFRGRTVPGLPHDKIRAILRRHGRLTE
jgi:L-aminopeptidase/D-esterase-like protein